MRIRRSGFLRRIFPRTCPKLCSGRQQEEEDGEEMADAAAEDEGMPDGVMVAKPMPDVEDDAGGVANAAGHEQRDAGMRNSGDEGIDHHEDEPAGHHVCESREGGGRATPHQLEDGA